MTEVGEPTDPVDPFKGTPYENSPQGWWTKHGGALDTASLTIFIPKGARLPCPFPCRNCQRMGEEET